MRGSKISDLRGDLRVGVRMRIKGKLMNADTFVASVRP